MSRDDNGRLSNMTSGETTPIMEERKTIKLERNSPLLKNVANWTPRSRSSDNLEKSSPLIGRKSPLIKMNTEIISDHSHHHDKLIPPTSMHQKDDKMKSPSNESIKSPGFDIHKNLTGNGIMKTPFVPPKPRPWSVLGSSETKTIEFMSDSTKTTPDGIDENGM